MHVDHPIISADSHITEARNTYTDYIDPAYRDTAPHVESTENFGDVYVIDGMRKTIPMGLIAAAGKPAEELSKRVRYEELHRSGYDSDFRLADQRVDGVSAEMIYPSVGMILCNHPDRDYQHACFDAYNEWITEFCSYTRCRRAFARMTTRANVMNGTAAAQKITSAMKKSRKVVRTTAAGSPSAYP